MDVHLYWMLAIPSTNAAVENVAAAVECHLETRLQTINRGIAAFGCMSRWMDTLNSIPWCVHLHNKSYAYASTIFDIIIIILQITVYLFL
jgi:hypothetical protein